jgi:hypothetical protein
MNNEAYNSEDRVSITKTETIDSKGKKPDNVLVLTFLVRISQLNPELCGCILYTQISLFL